MDQLLSAKGSFGYAHFLGYERGENKDDPPVVNQEQAATVRDIYRMFMEGKTGYMIAQTLTDNGIPTPAGKPIWCTSTVMSILQNEKYRGSAMLQKSFTTDFLTKKMKRNEGEVPKYYIEHSHEAIITPAEWDAVQEEIERRKSIGRAYSGVSVLGAKLICGDCGGTLSLSWTSENDSLTASSYTGTVTLQKVFTDGTNIYDAGVITNLSALAGKTLRKPEFFTVWWKDDDGTPLETDENVPYGTTPVYHGQTPVKPYDTSVAFSGWSPEITAATSNATYTAVYNSVVPVGSYIIYVNTPDNVTLTLVVNADDTVNSVKAKIQGLLGTVTQRQSLIFAGKVLEDGRILDDYNIQNESTLRLVYHNPFTGHSLSLEGEIGLNFYVSLTDEEIAAGTTVRFNWTVDGAEKTDAVTLTAADRTPDGYKASVPLPVAEMTYAVTATVVVGGVELVTDTYSVKEYADTILSDDYRTAYLAQEHTQEDYNKLEDLITTMLDYGARAQINFNRNTANLADQGLSYTMQEVTVDMIPSTASDMTEGLGAYGLQYAGTTLVYLAKTSMRHYYTIVDLDKFIAVMDSITFNGEKASYQMKDGKIYFELKNIAAADLDTVYTLRIGTNEYQSAALDYVRNCLSASNAPYNTKQLVMATYWYNQAANAYFGR